MRIFLILIISLLFTITSIAQNIQVPASIKTSFDTLHAFATDVTWGLCNVLNDDSSKVYYSVYYEKDTVGNELVIRQPVSYFDTAGNEVELHDIVSYSRLRKISDRKNEKIDSLFPTVKNKYWYVDTNLDGPPHDSIYRVIFHDKDISVNIQINPLNLSIEGIGIDLSKYSKLPDKLFPIGVINSLGKYTEKYYPMRIYWELPTDSVSGGYNIYLEKRKKFGAKQIVLDKNGNKIKSP